MSVKQFLMKPTQLSLQQRPSTTAEQFQLQPCKRSSLLGGFQQLWRHKVLPFLHRATTGHRNQHCLSYLAKKSSLQGIIIHSFTDVRCEKHLHLMSAFSDAWWPWVARKNWHGKGREWYGEQKPVTKLRANLGLPSFCDSFPRQPNANR